MKQYYVKKGSFYGKIPEIEEVECDRVEPDWVWIDETESLHSIRRCSEWEYYDTWEEAYQYLVNKCKSTIRGAKSTIAEYEKHLDDLNNLRR